MNKKQQIMIIKVVNRVLEVYGGKIVSGDTLENGIRLDGDVLGLHVIVAISEKSYGVKETFEHHVELVDKTDNHVLKLEDFVVSSLQRSLDLRMEQAVRFIAQEYERQEIRKIYASKTVLQLIDRIADLEIRATLLPDELAEKNSTFWSYLKGALK
jgi:hypothetical protein